MSIKYGKTADQIATSVGAAETTIRQVQGQIDPLNQQIANLITEVAELTQSLASAQQELNIAVGNRDAFALEMDSGTARPSFMLPEVSQLQTVLMSLSSSLVNKFGLSSSQIEQDGLAAYQQFIQQFNATVNNSGGQLNIQELGGALTAFLDWKTQYGALASYPEAVILQDLIVSQLFPSAASATLDALTTTFNILNQTVSDQSQQVAYLGGLIDADNQKIQSLTTQIAQLELQLAQAEELIRFFNNLTNAEKLLFKELYPNIVFPS